MTKYIILDAGAFINLAQNSLLSIFGGLAKIFQGNFIITPGVKYEAIDHPLNIKRFEWGALRVEHLITRGVVMESKELISDEELNGKTIEVMNKINNALFSDSKSIHLVERGESECLALSLLLKEKNIDSAVVIDERTARMLCEDPEKLRQLMENKLHTRIKMKYDQVKDFESIKVIRTPELMFLARKSKLLDGDKRTFEAVLYALKFGGCSITDKEIEMMKRM